MFVPFDSLPEESKIWIYQSNRKFSDEEIQEIEKDLTSFLEDWSAHGQQLEASFVTKYNRFIIIAVNQEVQAATGCSIVLLLHLFKIWNKNMRLIYWIK
jgi:hypothetical protein